MSIEQCVAFHKRDLPTTAALNSAAGSFGVDLSLEDADLASHTGFLPAKLNGADTGFEWYIGSADDFGDRGIDFGDRDCVCTFRTGSIEAETQCATVCAAALMTLTKGIYFDEYDGVADTPDRIIAEVRAWIEDSSA